MKTHLLSLVRVKLATRWEDTFVFNVADFHLNLYVGLCGEATAPAQCCGKTTKLNTKSVEYKRKEVRKYYALL